MPRPESRQENERARIKRGCNATDASVAIVRAAQVNLALSASIDRDSRCGASESTRQQHSRSGSGGKLALESTDSIVKILYEIGRVTPR